MYFSIYNMKIENGYADMMYWLHSKFTVIYLDAQMWKWTASVAKTHDLWRNIYEKKAIQIQNDYDYQNQFLIWTWLGFGHQFPPSKYEKKLLFFCYEFGWLAHLDITEIAARVDPRLQHQQLLSYIINV